MTDGDFWRRALTESCAAVATLLATDAQAHALKAVRAAFVAGDVPAEQAGAVKARATAQASALSDEIRAQLAAVDWLTVPWPADANPEDLQPLADAARRIQEGAAAAVQAAGLTSAAADGYRLPRRFIDGANLVQLVRSLGKAVAGLHAEAAQRREVDEATTHAARAAAWDEA